MTKTDYDSWCVNRFRWMWIITEVVRWFKSWLNACMSGGVAYYSLSCDLPSPSICCLSISFITDYFFYWWIKQWENSTATDSIHNKTYPQNYPPNLYTNSIHKKIGVYFEMNKYRISPNFTGIVTANDFGDASWCGRLHYTRVCQTSAFSQLIPLPLKIDANTTKKSDSHVIISVSTPVNLHIVIKLSIEHCNEHARILPVYAWNQHCRDACTVSERCDNYQISQLRDFPRFGGKMSTRLVKRGPAYISAKIRFILHFVKFVYVSMSQRVEILPRFLLDGWDPFLLHIQYHGGWRPADAWSQAISSCGIDLVIPGIVITEMDWYSEFNWNQQVTTSLCYINTNRCLSYIYPILKKTYASKYTCKYLITLSGRYIYIFRKILSNIYMYIWMYVYMFC